MQNITINNIFHLTASTLNAFICTLGFLVIFSLTTFFLFSPWRHSRIMRKTILQIAKMDLIARGERQCVIFFANQSALNVQPLHYGWSTKCKSLVAGRHVCQIDRCPLPSFQRWSTLCFTFETNDIEHVLNINLFWGKYIDSFTESNIWGRNFIVFRI